MRLTIVFLLLAFASNAQLQISNNTIADIAVINKEFKKQHINISFRQMEVYLKNMQGQEYKMVPIEQEHKTLSAPAPVPAAPKDVPEPPDVRLD